MVGRPLGKTKRVDAKGASDTKNGIGGYSIVQAEMKKPRQSCSARIIRISRCPAAGSKSPKSCIFPECEGRFAFDAFATEHA